MELNKENLYNEYIVKNKTIKECMEIFNCSKDKIVRLASENNYMKTGKNSNKKDTEDMKTQITNCMGKDYVLCGEYKSAREEITVLHTICGEKFSFKPKSIKIRGEYRKCPFCRKKMVEALYDEKISQKVKNILGDDYEFIKRDETNEKCILIKHNICGKSYKQSIKHLPSSVGCPTCWKMKQQKITDEEFSYYYSELGLSYSEMYDKFGITRAAYYHRVYKLNLKRTDIARKKIDKEKSLKITTMKTKYHFDKEQVKKLLSEGYSEIDIGKLYGCGKTAINCFVSKNNYGIFKNLSKNQERSLGKRIKTTMSKYGVQNVMDYPLFKEKHTQNRNISFISKPELEIKKYVEDIYGSSVTRFFDGDFELDIYIPEKKLGIEYNGNYWHSLKNKDKNYHYNKSKHFEEKGIRVIHIWEYEWNNERQRPILENIIKNALGLNMEKVYARKCSIEVRSSASMKDFFNENNIQGFRGGKFAICLVYNNEVIMAYMMGHCYFGKGKYQWEVIRGATKLGYTVVGGASKIWKYFIENYNPTNCVYYIDYNYFNGNSLPYLGLTYLKSQPGFKNWWVKTNTVKNREPQRHKEIKELYEKGEVVPIYNAGTKVYVWENHSIKLGNNTEE